MVDVIGPYLAPSEGALVRTPTSASWLNMVEIWCSILTKHQVRRGAHHDAPEPIAAIEGFIEGYNERAPRSCGPRPPSTSWSRPPRNEAHFRNPSCHDAARPRPIRPLPHPDRWASQNRFEIVELEPAITPDPVDRRRRDPLEVDGRRHESVAWTEEAVADADCVVMLTPHPEFSMLRTGARPG